MREQLHVLQLKLGESWEREKGRGKRGVKKAEGERKGEGRRGKRGSRDGGRRRERGGNGRESERER